MLPFLFIFNTDLLIDVGPFRAIFVFLIALAAMLLFTSGTMGWFLTRNKWYESAALVLTAFVLFRPGFFLDEIAPLTRPNPPPRCSPLPNRALPTPVFVFASRGVSIEGDAVDSTFYCFSAAEGDGATRLSNAAGIDFREEGGNMSSITSILADRRNSWASILTGRLSRLT